MADDIAGQHAHDQRPHHQRPHHQRPHHQGAHHRHLHVPGSSVVHRLTPAPKIAGTFAFVLAVAITPRHAVLAFAAYALVLGAVATIAGLGPRLIAARLVVVVPFLGFAVFLPFVAGGDHLELGPLSLSRAGLWAGFNVIAKAVLGAGASIVLSATTPIPDLLRGLQRLRVPAVVVAIIAFMFRYLDLLSDQLQRMRTAMIARGHDPRWLWQAKPIASSAGVLFVRSYERGERIHQAMLARGYDATMPALERHPPNRHSWIAALPALVAWTALASVWILR